MKRSAALTLLVACLLLAGCASVAPRLSRGDAAPVIKIGLIAPFEGLGRPLGYGLLPAVKTAIEAANADGRLGPYRVALVVLNDDLDPHSAARQAAALVQDPDVVAVLGPFTADTAAAAAPILTAANIPVLLPAPVDAMAGTRSLCPSPAEIQAVLLQGARAVVPSASDIICFSCSQNTICDEAMRPSTCKPSAHPPGHASLSAYPGDADEAQWVFFPGGAEAAAEELLARRAEGWDGALIGGPDVLKPWFIGRAGEASEGTAAAACALPGAPPDGALPEAGLARGGTEIILEAIASVVRQGGLPERASVAAALTTVEIAPSLTWYEVRGGAWRALQ
jgi:hypothetical protein